MAACLGPTPLCGAVPTAFAKPTQWLTRWCLAHHDAAGNDHYVRRGSGTVQDVTLDPRRRLVVATSFVSASSTLDAASDFVDGPNGLRVRRSLPHSADGCTGQGRAGRRRSDHHDDFAK